MKIFKRLQKIEEQQHLIDNYREQYEQIFDMYRTEEKRVFELKDELEEAKQEISRLQDEIDIQKSKAASYLSLYLKEMEKNLPNA